MHWCFMYPQFSVAVKRSCHTFYNVNALFTIIDALESNQAMYYEQLCSSTKNYLTVKLTQQVSFNTGDDTLDLLSWYALVEDWPFYIHRFQTHNHRTKKKRITCAITLGIRPLSWFGIKPNYLAVRFVELFKKAKFERTDVPPDPGGKPLNLCIRFFTDPTDTRPEWFF